MLGFDNLEGNDLKTDTNGQQDEFFDQQAGTSDVSWQVNDTAHAEVHLRLHAYFYDRNTDVDLTSNDDASTTSST